MRGDSFREEMRETYKTINTLHWYQKYRRGGISYEEMQRHCTNEEIGKAIDYAISELRECRVYQINKLEVRAQRIRCAQKAEAKARKRD